MCGPWHLLHLNTQIPQGGTRSSTGGCSPTGCRDIPCVSWLLLHWCLQSGHKTVRADPSFPMPPVLCLLLWIQPVMVHLSLLSTGVAGVPFSSLAPFVAVGRLHTSGMLTSGCRQAANARALLRCFSIRKSFSLSPGTAQCFTQGCWVHTHTFPMCIPTQCLVTACDS